MQVQATSSRSILAYRNQAETKASKPAADVSHRGIAVGEPVSISVEGHARHIQSQIAELPPIEFPTPDSVAKRLKDLGEMLKYKMQQAGIPTQAKFSLQVRPDGAINATGHYAQEVDQLLKDNPKLRDELRTAMAHSSTLASMSVAAAGTEAWQRLGDRAVGEVADRWLQFMQNAFRQIDGMGGQLDWDGNQMSSATMAKAREILASAPADLGFVAA
ncbi:hypothetical protein HNQ59_000662 [Chitinivorax tropicus]|uniref:DUF5610 domain-containing protein n=1 Tax=Chitinivorax tropicus TaxID=714531 RepID=A0A840MFF7_9PROT|nr:hypothetical protein [Chitinivorax tropicus]MBB5017398.1 hypothetical protein [Chitinivorax tropicus]